MARIRNARDMAGDSLRNRQLGINGPLPGQNVPRPNPAQPLADGGGGGSSSFDYASNPYYQQTLAAINASGAADAANTRAGIQQALIAFGFVPTGFKDKMGALDATTRELIEKNTKTGISGYARLLEGRTDGITSLVNRLQARGLRRSGARGAALRKNQLGFDRNFADSVASLLGQTRGMYGAYAQNEAARQNQLAQAMQWVYQNYYVPPSSSGPAPPPSSSSPSGPSGPSASNPYPYTPAPGGGPSAGGGGIGWSYS